MEKNKNGSLIVIIVILSLLVIFLGGYIVYDNFMNTSDNNDNSTNISENETKQENNEFNDVSKDENDCQLSIDENKYVEKRSCNGIYKGTVSVTKDVVTGEYAKGLLTIELKDNGTYNMTKENINTISGSYIIINNTLLLGEKKELCENNTDCSTTYTQYLKISDDCNTISEGYGSYFFDSNFTLSK